jgi:hypothetical protein
MDQAAVTPTGAARWGRCTTPNPPEDDTVDRTPRLTSVMGVARALLTTVDERETVEVLIAEFGWDVTFQALALLRGDAAARAFGMAWEHLVLDGVDRELGPLPAEPGVES